MIHLVILQGGNRATSAAPQIPTDTTSSTSSCLSKAVDLPEGMRVDVKGRIVKVGNLYITQHQVNTSIIHTTSINRVYLKFKIYKVVTVLLYNSHSAYIRKKEWMV